MYSKVFARVHFLSDFVDHVITLTPCASQNHRRFCPLRAAKGDELEAGVALSWSQSITN